MRRLPPEMTTPPSFRKVNPADWAVMFLALKSSQTRLSDVDAAGVVRHVWSPVKVDGHVEAVLARLDELGLSG